jgi:hypothetical protein
MPTIQALSRSDVMKRLLWLCLPLLLTGCNAVLDLCTGHPRDRDAYRPPTCERTGVACGNL